MSQPIKLVAVKTIDCFLFLLQLFASIFHSFKSEQCVIQKKKSLIALGDI